MVHLTFESLKPELRTLPNWSTVSSWSIFMSGGVAMVIGLSVYVTFWDESDSDMFAKYPSWAIIDVAKLLVCFMMLLTSPLPFFTSREMLVVAAVEMWKVCCGRTELPPQSDLEEPLLQEEEGETQGEEVPAESPSPSWLLPERQLVLSYHCIVTLVLWAVMTVLAVVAPSLGAVLDLVGCATGTVIGFVLPGLFAFRIQGYTHTAAMIFFVGGIVGMVGTYFSVINIINEY